MRSESECDDLFDGGIRGHDAPHSFNPHDGIFRKYISFEEDSAEAEIENFLPSLHRAGYKDAAFVHHGFIVRIRNGVEDLLEHLNESWNVVFFTAANRSVYEELMEQCHSHLSEIMGRDEQTDDPLWRHIFFREDCTYDFDERGKIYHHKDLTKRRKRQNLSPQRPDQIQSRSVQSGDCG